MTQTTERPQPQDCEPIFELASLLAAVHYSNKDGLIADDMLAQLARELRQRSLRLAGAIQHNGESGARRCADMKLEDLGSGRMISISQYRGRHARGCHLNSSALEEAVGLAAGALEDGADLLIINKFGKRECEGGGFRSVVDDALANGIRVIVGVNAASADGWADYTGGLAQSLPLDLNAALTWCLASRRTTGAAPTHTSQT